MVELRNDLDLAQEALADRGRKVWAQCLDRHRALMLEVTAQVDRRHATAADLAIDPVAAGKRLRQAIGLRHGTRILPDFPH